MKQSSKTFLDTSTSIHSIFTLEIRKVNSPLTLYCQTSQNVPRECIYQHMSEFLTQSACPRTSEVKWRSKFTIYFIFFNHLLIYLVFFLIFYDFFSSDNFCLQKIQRVITKSTVYSRWPPKETLAFFSFHLYHMTS